MNDTFEFTLNNPLTEEQWDEISDVDFDRTDRITFHTKHGKEVEFTKVRHGKWINNSPVTMRCNQCTYVASDWIVHEFHYCPNCGARMDEE